jgi:hypothetical protein
MRSCSAILAALRRVLPAVAVSCCACATATPGGTVFAAPQSCKVPADCPQNLQCVNEFCVVPNSDVAGGDAKGASDTSGATASPDANPTTDAPTATEVDTAPAPDTAADTGPDIPPDVGPKTMTILEIQSEPTSLTCTLPGGTVTTHTAITLESALVTGDPSSLSSKVFTFFVMPATGPIDGKYAGLQVISDTLPAVKAGDIVQLSGDVKEFYCNTELDVQEGGIIVTGKLPPPLPYVVPSAKLKTELAEPYEGVLVRMNDVVVVDANLKGDDGKTHGEFSVGSAPGVADVAVGPSPGVTWTFKNPKTGQIESQWKAGDSFASVSGHAWYTFAHFAVRARNDADLVK